MATEKTNRIPFKGNRAYKSIYRKELNNHLEQKMQPKKGAFTSSAGEKPGFTLVMREKSSV